MNTTYSAIRLTHIPTGLVVQCQDEKSQLKNFDKALAELRTRLYNMEYEKYLAEISAKRKEDMTKAYFNCHTDITIPYDEIGELTAICTDGTRKPIIENGRFVLAGCEELNIPLNELE